MSAPDPPLSPAALAVIEATQQHARKHPGAGRRGLVLLLARDFCRDMLKRKWRRDVV